MLVGFSKSLVESVVASQVKMQRLRPAYTRFGLGMKDIVSRISSQFKQKQRNGFSVKAAHRF